MKFIKNLGRIAFVLSLLSLSSSIFAQEIIRYEGKLVKAEFPDGSIRDDLFYTVDILMDPDADVWFSGSQEDFQYFTFYGRLTGSTLPLISAEYTFYEPDGSVLLDGFMNFDGWPKIR